MSFNRLLMPTYTINQLAQNGVTIADIAKYIGKSEEYVIENYLQEIQQAIIDKNVQVAMQVFEMALDGNLTACQFWLKNLGKWEDYSKYTPKIKAEDSEIFSDINITIGTTREDFEKD